MDKNGFITELKGSFAHGLPFIGWTQDYAYTLIPQADGSYKEISFDLHDKEVMEQNTIDVEKAYLRFLEEMEKGLGMEIEDFMLVKFKEIKEGLASKSVQDKFKGLLEKLMKEPQLFSKNLPVVKSQDDLQRIIKLI